MTLLKNKTFLLILVFAVVHLLLLNKNVAEWGDSYRILRASEYVRDLTYPSDEKRPPVFSAILGLRPSQVDPILWGRVVMFGFSVASFYLFSKLYNVLSQHKTPHSKYLALGLFAFNPVFLYWSLRIYADVPFSVIAMLALYLFTIWRNKIISKHLVILGILSALAVTTRFEGYILFVSLGLGLLYVDGFSSNFFENIKKRFVPIALYITAFLVAILPYYVWRNPLSSTYFEEPANRIYDLNTLLIFLLSLIFMFGFSQALYFVLQDKNNFLGYFKRNTAIAVFVAAEIILALVWPAAIPRLLIPVIPLLLIPLVDAISRHFAIDSVGIAEFFKKLFNAPYKPLPNLFSLILLVGIYVVGQYYYRLQFLVLMKEWFAIAVAIQLILTITVVLKNTRLFYALVMLSVITWSLSTIYLHKDIYIGVKKASHYAQQELCGNIAYNDVSSVSDWYLNSSPKVTCTSGFYHDVTIKDNRTYESLTDNNVDYILITNEHNTTLTFNTTNYPHIKKLKSFEYTINGKDFFTNLYKFER